MSPRPQALLAYANVALGVVFLAVVAAVTVVVESSGDTATDIGVATPVIFLALLGLGSFVLAAEYRRVDRQSYGFLFGGAGLALEVAGAGLVLVERFGLALTWLGDPTALSALGVGFLCNVVGVVMARYPA